MKGSEEVPDLDFTRYKEFIERKRMEKLMREQQEKLEQMTNKTSEECTGLENTQGDIYNSDMSYYEEGQVMPSYNYSMPYTDSYSKDYQYVIF